MIEYGARDVELSKGALDLGEASWPLVSQLLGKTEFEVLTPIRVRLAIRGETADRRLSSPRSGEAFPETRRAPRAASRVFKDAYASRT